MNTWEMEKRSEEYEAKRKREGGRTIFYPYTPEAYGRITKLCNMAGTSNREKIWDEVLDIAEQLIDEVKKGRMIISIAPEYAILEANGSNIEITEINTPFIQHIREKLK